MATTTYTYCSKYIFTTTYVVVVPPTIVVTYIKSTVRFRQRIKNRRLRIQTFKQNKNCRLISPAFAILTTFCSEMLRFLIISSNI